MPDTTDPFTVLAFDYGAARIGVAVGQSVSGTATPLTTFEALSDDARQRAIRELIESWRPRVLLVGDPRSMAPGDPVRAAIRRFADALAEFDLPVEFVDESLSSVEAHARLKDARRRRERRRIGKPEIDAEAARVIAERWLSAYGDSARMRRHGEPGPDTADA